MRHQVQAVALLLCLPRHQARYRVHHRRLLHHPKPARHGRRSSALLHLHTQATTAPRMNHALRWQTASESGDNNLYSIGTLSLIPGLLAIILLQRRPGHHCKIFLLTIQIQWAQVIQSRIHPKWETRLNRAYILIFVLVGTEWFGPVFMDIMLDMLIHKHTLPRC